jgi:hypothetical protein
MSRSFVLVFPLVVSGCLFLPAIEDDGYLACTSDGDCGVGRTCALEVGLCAPPPWNDTAFTARQMVVVENPGAVALPAGTAVPVQIGGEGAPLSLDDVGADARFTDFDAAADTWRVVGVSRDLFADRFTVWIPLAREVPAGRRDVLAWLEQGTAAGTPTVLEDPANTFALFDDLDDFPADAAAAGADDSRYRVFAQGGVPFPGVDGGELTVGDNVTVIWRGGFVPPVDVTFRARVNGLTCDEVYLGLTGAEQVGFNPPSAGFFMQRDLLTVGEVAPTSTSTPTPLSDPTIFSEQPNALHRFRVQADGASVRFLVDDVLFDERTDLRPAFAADARLFPMVQMGGACSVDIDAVWVTPLPSAPSPTVSVEAPVLLNITF